MSPYYYNYMISQKERVGSAAVESLGEGYKSMYVMSLQQEWLGCKL